MVLAEEVVAAQRNLGTSTSGGFNGGGGLGGGASMIGGGGGATDIRTEAVVHAVFAIRMVATEDIRVEDLRRVSVLVVVGLLFPKLTGDLKLQV
eukprot:gene23854-25434_t